MTFITTDYTTSGYLCPLFTDESNFNTKAANLTRLCNALKV